MKLSIWAIGKTDEKYLEEGIEKYIKRLKHYVSLEYEVFKDVKPGINADETSRREAEMILAKIKPEHHLIIMDERGKQYDSVAWSDYLMKCQLRSLKQVTLLIGGAYGHHELIRQRANDSISLSKMTFSHQMVRLFLVEQVYRAYTIIKNEKYHNI